MSATTPARPHYLSLSPERMRSLVAGWGEPAYRAQQISDWVFKRRAASPEAMTNLSQALRQRLGEEFAWDLPEIASKLDGQDGSTKLLFKSDRGYIESVILRYEGRTSLCVSSQVGCKLACSFCQTGSSSTPRWAIGTSVVTKPPCSRFPAMSRVRGQT